MKNCKVAIYSGIIPSTTFIERLIDGLSKKGVEVYLFGKLNEKVIYSETVKKVVYRNRFSKFCQLFYYSILLKFKFPEDKKKLDIFIKNKEGNINAMKIKFYPVLYYRPDIFHLQWAKGISDWIWVEEFNIRLVLSLRGTHITISPYANEDLANEYKMLFPKISGFHVVSEATLKSAINFGLNTSKAKVIYSGLNFTQLPFQPRIENKSGKIKILSIGRAHWVKGYDYALDAMYLLKNQEFTFEYKIIGLGEDESLLFQRSQLGLDEVVVFEKNESFDSIKKRIREADIMLLSSVEEGIANVVLEAMALGTLVISTNCGGMSEVIESGENGILVPVRNPEAMAQAIIKVSQFSSDDYQKMILKARETIEKQHSENKMIDDMKALYKHIIS